MKMLFLQCMDCEYGIKCYSEDFSRCRKIESAGQGLGVQVKHKDNSYLKDIPFGVHMGLKHILAIVEKDIKIKNKLRDVANDHIYSQMEFSKKLAIETAMTYNDSCLYVTELDLFCDINEAIKIYDDHGIRGLDLYLIGVKQENRLGLKHGAVVKEII